MAGEKSRVIASWRQASEQPGLTRSGWPLPHLVAGDAQRLGLFLLGRVFCAIAMPIYPPDLDAIALGITPSRPPVANHFWVLTSEHLIYSVIVVMVRTLPTEPR